MSDTAALSLPDIDSVRAAARRIEGHAIRTPLINLPVLDDLAGCRVFLKAENLQRTGSFKFRGGYNTLATMSADERNRGVLAISSGNHAQGVADAARIFGVPATIIMPGDAPATKVERTRRLGAEVILYDRMKEDREALAASHCERTGAALIHPFNDPRVISGQGTAGLEACETLQALGVTPDHVLVCTGGGGLTAGVALAVEAHFPDAVIHTCEPEGFDDYRRSLKSGKLESNAAPGGSVCDAIVTPTPGTLGFAINSRLAGEGFAASDAEVLAAVAICFRELKLVVEPGGAIALACLLRNRAQLAGSTVLATLSGGNMDPQMLARALAEPQSQ